MGSSILEVRTRMDLQGTWNVLGCSKNHGQLAQDGLSKSPYNTEMYLSNLFEGGSDVMLLSGTYKTSHYVGYLRIVRISRETIVLSVDIS